MSDLPANIVHAFRGIPANASDRYDTTFGLFFADSRRIAAGYAPNGRVIEVGLDLSNATTWTTGTTRQFQDYVISCLHQYHDDRRLPPGVRAALRRFNKRTDSNLTLDAACGGLLRTSPAQVGWQELDPLMGFVRDFIRPDDVIIRPHEYGGGIMNGTEYIVFSARRIKALK